MNALRSVLRGVSQIFFVQNALSGVVLLLALALVSPWMAAFVLLGSAVQCLGAWALDLRDQIPGGLMGYNGALVGAAAFFHLSDGTAAIWMTIAGALACVPVHQLVRRLFASKTLGWAQLPVSTAPFCIVAGLLTGVILPLSAPGAATSHPELVQGSLLGLFNSFSEVMLGDGLWTGVLTVIALLIGSVAIGVFGLLGSALAIVGALLVHQPVDASTGILGYSAVLVAIAIGAVFWTDRPRWQRLLGAAVGVALTMLIQPLLAMTPVPVYTWPFLLAMWIVLAAGAAVGRGSTASAAPAHRAAVS